MSGSKAGEEKEYEKELGGTITRIWSSIASGPMRHLEHVSAVGPKGQNGGELILEAGECFSSKKFKAIGHGADELAIP